MAMTYQLRQPASYTPARYVTGDVVRGATDVAAPQSMRERSTLGFGAVVVVLAIIVAAVVGFGSDAAASGTLDAVSDSSEIVDTIEIYVVQPGDTLWEIANSISLPGEDVRPLVDALQEISGGSDLDVGQRLIIDHAMIRG